MTTQTEKLSEIAQRHFDAEDMLRAGTFGFNDGKWNGAGCSVGCFAYEAGATNDDDIHAFVAEKYGLPEWVVRLNDCMFEGLARSDNHRKWHVDFFQAAESVTDWKSALHRVHCAILDIALEYAGEAKPAVQTVRDLHARQETNSKLWSAARSAAESAATSAEWSAEWSAAWSAAWSAVVSAAESAVVSAARSAAESAATSAEWSAEWSATYVSLSKAILEALRGDHT